VRLELIPAQQIIGEVGVQASTFPSAAELTCWVRTCPGKDESAEENHSIRSAKGNKYLHRELNQAAHAAVKKKGSHFHAVFRRLLPRLGYQSRHLGRRSSALPYGLEDLARRGEQDVEPDPRPRRNALRCWRELFATLGTKSQSHP
jgi:transposase